MREPGPPNRSRFEHWLARWGGWAQETIRNARANDGCGGYEDRGFDMAWAAWCAALERHPKRQKSNGTE